MEGIPVNKDVVSWARERAGFSLEEAANDFKKIALWEAGEDQPSYPQIEKMADKFKCPVAIFFFPEPPQEEKLQESFRTLSEEDFNSIPKSVKSLLRKGVAMRINLSELNDDKNDSERIITRDLGISPDISVDELASIVRDYLGVSLEEQYEWRSDEAALENWRQILNDVGVFTFKDPFKNDGYSGFCLYDEEFPIIYLNNSTAKTKQIFTLFHELAHLIFHTSGVDKLDDDYIAMLPNNAKKIEVVCNRFAGRFLVPDHAFDQLLAQFEPTRDSAEKLADRFSVSREAIYRKFLDRNLIDIQEYKEAASLWASQVKKGDGGNYYYSQMSYLGRQYIDLAFKRYYQDRFDSVQLAEYLNIKPKNLATFEETYLRVST